MANNSVGMLPRFMLQIFHFDRKLLSSASPEKGLYYRLSDPRVQQTILLRQWQFFSILTQVILSGLPNFFPLGNNYVFALTISPSFIWIIIKVSVD